MDFIASPPLPITRPTWKGQNHKQKKNHDGELLAIEKWALIWLFKKTLIKCSFLILMLSLSRKNSMCTNLVISNFHLEYVGTWLWYNIILATRPDKMTQHQPLPAAQLCLSAQECLKAQLVLSVHFGSTSLSLVTWIFAPDLSWRYLIVFLGFPIITTTLPFGISIFLLVPWYPYEEYRGAPLCEDNGGIEEPCLNTSAMCPLYQPEQQGSTTKFS